MKKITISTLILLAMVVGNVEIAFANNDENGLNCKVQKEENSKTLNLENLNELIEKELKEPIEEIEEIEEKLNGNYLNMEKTEENHLRVNKGWNLINGKYFYIDENKELKKGWYNDGYDWYHLNENTGEMTVGWYNDGYDYYYFESTGVMSTGWKNINNNWYYLNSNGTMATGWINLSGQWYYLESNGVMVTGYKTIEGKKYYFESNGLMNNGMGLVIEARKHVGKKYVSGGTGPNSFDCSGLTKYVYKQMDIELTRTTYSQVKEGRAISRDQLQVGDLVFSHGPASSPGHVGIYSGNGKYVHAANAKQGVIESTITKYSTARRIIE